MTGKDRVARYEANAPTQSVLFLCDAGHSTEIKFHVQVEELPSQWDCSICHKPAKFAAAITPQSDEKVPDPRRGYVDPTVLSPVVSEDRSKVAMFTGDSAFTKEHHAALLARRTEAELEALLEGRLAILRTTGAAGRPLGF